MLYYISIVTLIWLLAGFIAGLKLIYIDKVLSKENIEEKRKEVPPEQLHIFDNVVTKRATFLASVTLLGFAAIILDISSTLKPKDDKKNRRRMLRRNIQ